MDATIFRLISFNFNQASRSEFRISVLILASFASHKLSFSQNTLFFSLQFIDFGKDAALESLLDISNSRESGF